jgi:peptide/nickel transport system ATP-binding protein
MLLTVKDLQVSFSSRRGRILPVQGVSFELQEGETLCLVGESGSGKSVTSLALMGLVEAPGKIEGGSAVFAGQTLFSYTPSSSFQRSERQWRQIRGSQISMIFQDPLTSLNPSYTVGYQIQEVLQLHENYPRRVLKEKVIEALQRVAIPSPEERLKDYPFRLSGGMRQRVMIAMAMACKPKVLIADEPTTALDVTIQAQILALMNELKTQEKTAFLFITHDFGVVSEMADRIAVMYTGKIVEQSTAKQLFRNPRHPYTEGLLKSRPSQSLQKKSRLYSIPDKVPSLYHLPSGCTFWPRCPYAQEKCKQEVPVLKPIESDHQVACFAVQGELS